MDEISLHILPDIIVHVCPLGCNGSCAGVWINKTIGNKIICRCQCAHNKKQVALLEVEGPDTSATRMIQPHPITGIADDQK